MKITRSIKIVFTFVVVLILLTGYETIPPNCPTNQKPSFYVTTSCTIPKETVLEMIEDLGNVTGIQLTMVLPDNSSESIIKLRNNLDEWVNGFNKYEISVQIGFNFFNSTYGYLRNGIGIYYLSSFSEEFYKNLYGNISSVLNNHLNVKLFLGFNEPQYHLEKQDYPTLCRREYETWKKYSNISFTTELSIPYEFWAKYLGYPENPNIETDYFPCWQYSDFIGVNFYPYSQPQINGCNFTIEDENRLELGINTLLNYSKTLGKPVCIAEFPSWSEKDVHIILENFGSKPNCLQIYQLWAWSEDIGKYDGWIYGLYNVDRKMQNFSRVEPNWEILNSTS
jgi:hypothetical protein